MYRMDPASRAVIVNQRHQDLHREAAEAKLLRGASWDGTAPEPKGDRFVVRPGIVTRTRVRLLHLLGGPQLQSPRGNPRPVR
jgi:hypothetical protein